MANRWLCSPATRWLELTCWFERNRFVRTSVFGRTLAEVSVGWSADQRSVSGWPVLVVRWCISLLRWLNWPEARKKEVSDSCYRVIITQWCLNNSFNSSLKISLSKNLDFSFSKKPHDTDTHLGHFGSTIQWGKHMLKIWVLFVQ